MTQSEPISALDMTSGLTTGNFGFLASTARHIARTHRPSTPHTHTSAFHTSHTHISGINLGPSHTTSHSYSHHLPPAESSPLAFSHISHVMAQHSSKHGVTTTFFISHSHPQSVATETHTARSIYHHGHTAGSRIAYERADGRTDSTVRHRRSHFL